jgi:hypothetical protein
MEKRNHNINTKKVRQYRSNQGRSPEKMSHSYYGCAITLIGLILCLICILILN